MRHAKSSWGDSSLADIERPLNGRGKRDAPKMGHFLDGQDLVPHMILCSSAQRTRDTAKGLWDGWGTETNIEFLPSFYHGGAEEFVEQISTLADEIERVMILGHNPGMEYFVEELAGAYERMPTAAVALIVVDIKKWQYLSGDFESELKGYWIPREIKAE